MRSHLRRAELDPRRLVIYGVLGVWVWAVGGAHADAYEPDDTAENATLIEANETQTGRSIDPAGDVDWIRFTVDEDSKVIVQAKVDTDTLNPVGGSTHPGHPGDHPVTWCHYFDGGRSWVTSLGHDVGAWQGTTEGSEYFKQHVLGGILSTAGAKPFCT